MSIFLEYNELLKKINKQTGVLFL